MRVIRDVITSFFACVTLVASFYSQGYASKIENTKLTPLFPRGCESRGFVFNAEGHLILNDTGQQAFYLINNPHQQWIELERVETHETFLIPALTAKIDPMHWAAFSSNIEALHFECRIKENNQFKPVPCDQTLEVCQYPRVKYSASNRGNYWVSINKMLKGVIQDAVRQGIYLRW
ncbi:MAG: enhanced entry protein EnhB [Legionella sp.]|nr:enhanced entry protein EnhB [Legionella sp.]